MKLETVADVAVTDMLSHVSFDTMFVSQPVVQWEMPDLGSRMPDE